MHLNGGTLSQWKESHWKLSALWDFKIVGGRKRGTMYVYSDKGISGVGDSSVGPTVWRVSLALPIKHVKWNVRCMYKGTRRWMYQFQGGLVDFTDRLIGGG